MEGILSHREGSGCEINNRAIDCAFKFSITENINILRSGSGDRAVDYSVVEINDSIFVHEINDVAICVSEFSVVNIQD